MSGCASSLLANVLRSVWVARLPSSWASLKACLSTSCACCRLIAPPFLLLNRYCESGRTSSVTQDHIACFADLLSVISRPFLVLVFLASTFTDRNTLVPFHTSETLM